MHQEQCAGFFPGPLAEEVAGVPGVKYREDWRCLLFNGLVRTDVPSRPTDPPSFLSRAHNPPIMRVTVARSPQKLVLDSPGRRRHVLQYTQATPPVRVRTEKRGPLFHA